MPIIVHSPYSGRPIKIRDQDIGRALRDEEGRIFYAVPRTGGNGYYGAPTRRGSEKDEQRYNDLLAKSEQARQAGAAASAAQVHDAMGKSRGSLRRWIVLILLLLILVIVGYVAWIVFADDTTWNPLDQNLDLPIPQTPGESPAPDTAPQLPDTAPPEPQAAATTTIAPISFTSDPAAAATSTGAERSNAPDPPVANATPPPDDYTTTASGLKYRTLRPGRGTAATAGSYVLIHYTARLTPDGPILDTSRSRPESAADRDDDDAADAAASTDDEPDSADQHDPIGFVLWSGSVIRGWDIGIAGMKIGEVRQLVVPPHLIAADRPAEADAAERVEQLDTGDAALHFEIELVDVLPGVLHETTHEGSVGGRIASPGQKVTVHYTAYIDDREQPFDDSRSRSAPLTFRLGVGDVIRGWDLGILGMKEGEQRILVIPPYLAYGQRGITGLIPPDTTLRYHLELIQVHDE